MERGKNYGPEAVKREGQREEPQREMETNKEIDGEGLRPREDWVTRPHWSQA